MKRWLKISLISFGSFVALLLIAVTVVVSVVLSPKRLTNIVNREAPRLVSCDFSLKKADLTFFKTFPNVGVAIHQLTLTNPMAGAPSDTLLKVDECIAVVNIRELIKNQNIITKKVYLNDGCANLFVDRQGKANFDILKIKSQDTTSSEFAYDLDLRKIKIRNLNVNYLDLKSLLSASVKHLDLGVKGCWREENALGKVKIKSGKLNFATLDSAATRFCYNQLQFDFSGAFKHLDRLDGKLKLDIEDAGLKMGCDQYLDAMDLALNTELSASLLNQYFSIQNADLKIDDYGMQLSGDARRNVKSGSLHLNMQYQTGRWPLKEVLCRLPRAVIGDVFDGLHVDGKARLNGSVIGDCNSNQLPLITADIDVDDGSFAMDGLPLAFRKINTNSYLSLDLNGRTDLSIKSLSAYTGRNYLTAKGVIRDLLGAMLFDLDVTGDLHLADFKQLLPEELTLLSGDAKGSVKVKCDLEQLSSVALDKMVASASFQFQNLALTYDDSLSLSTPAMSVSLHFPVNESPYGIGEWVEAKIQAAQLNVGKLGLASLQATDAQINAFVNNVMDSTLELKLGTDFSFNHLSGIMDTMDVLLKHPEGNFVMNGSEKLSLTYVGESVLAHLGAGSTVRAGEQEIFAKTNYRPQEQNLLLRWNPTARLKLADGAYMDAQLPYPVQLARLQANLTVHKFELEKCQAKFGDSDLDLTGDIVDIDEFMKGKKLLRGDLELVSNYININQIMDVASDFGDVDTVQEEEVPVANADPFIVPKNVNLNLHTNIRKALYEDAEIRNVGGDVTIKNGILVLDQMGLTSDAARIQMTAMYRTPRRNHLILGLDFHLLDVKIADLIEMIPAVDTVLPMLKNFAGNAEFHFAINTALNANYSLKFSTLRGAAAISGKDLVVLDNETYQKISKLLLFKKKTVNKIDSLSAEITVFKNEVDVYPFAVSIDKYQAILSGRHNLDMTYDYNITLAKPVRLGLEIEGKDKLKIRLTKPKYAKLYNPRRQGVLEQNTMTLKNQIRQALEANVKPQ